MKILNKEQALAVMGFTGFTTMPFGKFHEDVEKRLGYPVWSHQFGDEKFMKSIKELYKDDFISICIP